MLDNTVLDIVIGLSFIFLLYSLMATALLELIAGLFNYRPSMLQRGIEQMLDGENYYYFWWERLANFFRLNIFYRDYNNKLNKEGREHIGLVNDYLPTKKEKILSADKIDLSKVFHSSEYRIIEVDKNVAIEDGKFVTPKKNNLDSKFHTKGSEIGKALPRGKLDKKASLFSAIVFNHPIYKHSAGNTRLSKEPAYLTADKFSDIMVDILGNKMSEASVVQPILMKEIKKNIAARVKPNNEELYDILNIYVDQANGDLQRFRWLLEIWFNDQMERLTGWYKRQTSYLLFIIGLVLAVSFNIDSIEIVNKLEKNPDLAHRMADGATAYIKNVNNADFNAEKASKQLDTLYNKSLDSTTSMLATGWGSYGNPVEALVDQQKANLKVSDNFKKNIKELAIKLKIDTSQYRIVVSKRNSTNDLLQVTTCEKVSYVFTHIGGIKLIGFLITALAISFGSPFWFDLLSKLANLRSAGKRPSEDSDKNKSKSQNMQPDVNSFG